MPGYATCAEDNISPLYVKLFRLDQLAQPFLEHRARPMHRLAHAKLRRDANELLQDVEVLIAPPPRVAHHQQIAPPALDDERIVPSPRLECLGVPFAFSAAGNGIAR